ncbi:hypothetical protein SynBIOSE41_03702 [Synechococcus sp. BIOS-E4-1]|nr:hypothetical protein SynBIOSE41_03702 [Synechococcus sp. BIOS-E4-1]
MHVLGLGRSCCSSIAKSVPRSVALTRSRLHHQLEPFHS